MLVLGSYFKLVFEEKVEPLWLCKNFNVALKDINTKLGILAHHDKVQLQDKGT